MSTILTSIAPIWKVLLVGLVLGAGLPAVFALGIKLWSAGTATPDGAAASLAGRVGAAVCFLLVVLVVIAGITVLAASKAFLARFGLS